MEIVITPDLAYVFSNLIVGDGGLYTMRQKSKNCKKGYYTIYQINMSSTDKEYVEEFNERICRLLGKTRLMKLQLIQRPNRLDLWKTQVSCKKEFYEWVKSRSDEFIADLWRTHPKEFLQSWFDSDGTASPTKHNGGIQLALTNSNEKWIRFAQQLLRDAYGIEIGLYLNQHLKSGKTQWTLQTGKRSVITEYYKQIGFVIKRKQETLKRWLGE